MNIRCRAAFAVASLVLAFATPAGAGDTILAVTGKVTGGEMNLTLAEIEALGTARIVPTTPWHGGRVTFEGVPMRVSWKPSGRAAGWPMSAWQINSSEIE